MAADMRAHLEAGLDPAHRALLDQVRRAAAGLGLPTYLAGGLVRDLLLGRPTTDLDFVVVPQPGGDPSPAATLARALAQGGGEVTVHAAFGTATWHSAEGAALDVATARTETYSHPGALPTVTPATDIETDLTRRDFTVNALAIRVDGEHLGDLVDPRGGQADLRARIMRVLHPHSFQDDPTRIVRAVRYEQRLGFRLDDATARLIPAALPVIRVLSGERVRHELELIFREQLPPVALARLQALSALGAIDEALHWGVEATADAGVVRDLPRPTWKWAAPLDVDGIYFTLLLRGAAPGRAAQALERLSVTRAVQEAVTGALGLTLTGARPSDVVARLEPLTFDAVVAAYVAQPAAREWIDTYLSRWRFIRAKITGDDLIAMGLPPGPRFKRILGRLRAARLDGEVNDEAGELALVRELAGLE